MSFTRPRPPMRGLGYSSDPSTYDLGTHRPADQLAEAMLRSGIHVGDAEPPASSGMPHNVYPLDLVRRQRSGIFALGLADPPGGSAAPATPGGLPGSWVDDSHYKDALGNLWGVVKTTGAISASSGAYPDMLSSSISKDDLQFQIDHYVAQRNPHGIDPGTASNMIRAAFAVGAIAATLTIGAVTGVVLLVRHARKPRSNPRRRTNPRRRRRRRR